MLDNDVNRTGTNNGESPSSGRCPMAQQHGPGRHPTTAGRMRRKWTQQENRIVMECFYLSDPKTRGYRKRMHMLWKDRKMVNVTEQRLIDQKNQIIKKQWLSSLELEEIQRNVEDATYGGVARSIVEKSDPDLEMTTTGGGSERVDPQIERNEQVDGIKIKDGVVLIEEDREVLKMMVKIKKKPRIRLPAMSGIDGVKLKETVKKVNGVLEKLKIDNITEMNDTIHYGAPMVCEILGFRKKKVHDWKEPWWKKRLTTQIREMNKDLGRVNALIDKKTIKKRHQDTFERKYKIKHKRLHAAKEEIRQRTKAKTAKISRYQQQINQYQQNRMFRNNESRFYKNLTMILIELTKMPYLMQTSQESSGQIFGVIK